MGVMRHAVVISYKICYHDFIIFFNTRIIIMITGLILVAISILGFCVANNIGK
jgi:hypothetical protein